MHTHSDQVTKLSQANLNVKSVTMRYFDNYCNDYSDDMFENIYNDDDDDMCYMNTISDSEQLYFQQDPVR